MTEAFAPASFTASATVLNTGMPSCVVPPLPGVTPPTTFVPYSSICMVWNVPSLPVMPCTTRRVDLSTRTLIEVSVQVRDQRSIWRRRARSITIEERTHKELLLSEEWNLNLVAIRCIRKLNLLGVKALAVTAEVGVAHVHQTTVAKLNE